MPSDSPVLPNWQCDKPKTLRYGEWHKAEEARMPNAARKQQDDLADPMAPMTIEEFLEFTDTRPDGEKWELIEGVAVLSPSPVDVHQVIVGNLITELMLAKRRLSASWIPLIGIGTMVPASPNSLPQPDVFVMDRAATGSPLTDDARVIFEVLSRSNSKADQAWRRKVYASVPNCQHYVTISQKAADVVVYNRAAAWKPLTVKGLDGTLDLGTIGANLPLSDIYRYTPLSA
jgi:Uma2 family endonuclease